MGKAKRGWRLAAAVLAIGALAAPTVRANLMVEAVVSPIGGGGFHYEFAVVNATLADAFLVTLTDAPLDDALITATLTAPAGFLANYDPGLGLIDFIADAAGFFPLGTTAGFAFDSLFGPTANFTLFQAFTESAFPDPAAAGQVSFAAVPAPAGIALWLLGLTGFFTLRKAS
ncbi:MAG: hypothetical protein M3Z21_02105 [Pseudomonadota bacterium]|nr:hypothetical protein [Pseudomonadota bacterium]